MKGRRDRPARVAGRIREEVSLILQNRVRDPGLESVTVTDVSVTPDLSTARIRYTVMGGEGERRAAVEALRRCKGFIRRELGKELRMRLLPEVSFQYDESLETGMRIERLLREIGTDEPDEE
jgi:ribosome-binding factor A